MAVTKVGLRSFWFQFHKWIGLALAILIIPLCLTGSALVWHDWVDAKLNPERHSLSSGTASLPPSAYVGAARDVLPTGHGIVSLRMPKGEAVVVTAAPAAQPGVTPRGRPVRTMVYLDPGTGKVIDTARSNAGPVAIMHSLHGNFLYPGWGRTAVGWVGVAMLISSRTGIWVWWPVAGSLIRGLRWRRHRNFDTNLHHLMGFWISIPLFILSATGVWISFPSVFGPLVGVPAPRTPVVRPQPIAAPLQSLDSVVAGAAKAVDGKVSGIDWPTDRKSEWTVTLGKRSAKVDEASGAVEAVPPKPAPPEPVARLMRRIHDGTNMGVVWQIIVFLGGLLPAALAVTGVIMWWRARDWRGEVAERRRPVKV